MLLVRVVSPPGSTDHLVQKLSVDPARGITRSG